MNMNGVFPKKIKLASPFSKVILSVADHINQKVKMLISKHKFQLILCISVLKRTQVRLS